MLQGSIVKRLVGMVTREVQVDSFPSRETGGSRCLTEVKMFRMWMFTEAPLPRPLYPVSSRPEALRSGHTRAPATVSASRGVQFPAWRLWSFCSSQTLAQSSSQPCPTLFSEVPTPTEFRSQHGLTTHADD